MMYHDEQARRETRGRPRAGLRRRRGRAHPDARRVEGIVDPPLLWRYFLMPRPAQASRPSALPADDFVVRAVMGINAGVDGAFVASSGKNMGAFKGVGYPEEIGRVLPPRGVRGPHLDSATTASRPTPPAGGAARTRSRCSTGPSSTTASSRATASTAATSSSSATAARSAPTPRSRPTSSTCCCAATACRSSSPARCSPARCGARSTAWPRTSASWRSRCARSTGRRCSTARSPSCSGFNGGMVALNDRIKLRPLVAARQGLDPHGRLRGERAARGRSTRRTRVWSPQAGEPVIARVEGMPGRSTADAGASPGVAGVTTSGEVR